MKTNLSKSLIALAMLCILASPSLSSKTTMSDFLKSRSELARLSPVSPNGPTNEIRLFWGAIVITWS